MYIVLKNQTILVTGGHGFLGKQVVEKLKVITNKVVYPKSTEYNLVSKKQTKKLFKKYKPDIVVHLAAQVGGIDAIITNSGKYFYNNMMMGLNVIENSRLSKIEKIIYISSGCAYPNLCSIPFKEQNIWDGYVNETVAPYAIPKKAMLTMLQSYFDQYNLNSISLIPTNLYGPGDHFDSKSSHVIPSLIRKIIQANVAGEYLVECWGSGNQTRDFLYVEDAAEAIINAISMDIKNPITINLGSGIETSIKEIVYNILDISNIKLDIIWNENKPEGQPRRLMDIEKAKNILNWKPKTRLRIGLKNTIDYYRNIL